MEFKLFDKERDIKFLKRLAIAVVVIACLLIIKDEILWDIGYYDDLTGELTENNSYDEEYFGYCNVAKIDLKGFIDIEAYEDGDVGSSDIIWAIENAENSDDIQAIILDVDSSGGVAVAGEEISNALSYANKPTVGLVRGMANSSAYWAIIGTDKIFASKNSDIGSIGATMSYLDYSKQNQLQGINYNSISSGEFKDAGDPNKTLTWEEKQYFLRDINIIADNFIEAVVEKRNLSIEEVKKIADGSSMLGEKALEKGLIDEIGDLYDVRQYLEDLIGEEVVLCEEY